MALIKYVKENYLAKDVIRELDDVELHFWRTGSRQQGGRLI